MPVVPVGQPDDGQLVALGLTLDTASAEIPAELHRAHADAAVTSARLAELASLPLPVTERGGPSPGPAWPDQASRQRDAILQPPHHEITPATQVIDRYQQASAHTDRAEPEREAE